MCKIIASFFGGEWCIFLQHSRFFNNATVRLHVVVKHSSFHHALEHFHFFNGEMLNEAKVEEGNFAAFVEDVIAWVRVAIKGTEAIQAAKHETEDGFAGFVTVFLWPCEKFCKRMSADKFRDENA